MPWNSISPLGTVSVKANRAINQQNTTYTEVTMGNQVVGTNPTPQTAKDHFWNVGGNEDGHHRFIQSPRFTSNAVAPNDVYPVVAPGMDTVLFPLLTNGTVQWFHRNNADYVYQFIPRYVPGTVLVTSSSTYDNIIAVPANVYGEILMFTDLSGKSSAVTGFFVSGNTKVEAWTLSNQPQGQNSSGYALKFGNGSESVGFNLRVRCEDAAVGQTWNYRITYRAK